MPPPSDHHGQGPHSDSPDERSELLNEELPDDIAAMAAAEGVRPDEAWLTARTDLDLSGSYAEVYLLALPEELVVVGRPATPDAPAVRRRLTREGIAEVRTRQGVGGGFVEVLIDGIYAEVLAFSNARADVFRRVVAKLQTWRAGQTPPVGPEDDEDPRTCPQCGMPLQYRGDICKRCIKSGAVLVRVFKLMKPYTGKAIIMMALVATSIGLSLIPQLLVRFLVNVVLAPQQAGNPPLPLGEASRWLLLVTAGLLGIHAVISATAVIIGRLSSYVGTQITYDMRNRVFRHLMRLSVGFFDRYSTGQLMSRVVGDTAQMQGFVRQLTNGFLRQFLTLVAVTVAMFMLNWKLTLITLLPAPIVVAAAVFFWRRIYPRYYRVWDGNSKLHGVLNTILGGVRVVKAFGQEGREQDRFAARTGYVRDSFRGVQYTVTAFNPSIAFVFRLGGILVWLIGGQWVLGLWGVADKLDLGDLLAFLGYQNMFFMPLQHLTQFTNWLTSFLTASQRTFEILDTQPEIVEAAEPKELPAAGGSIRFENVTFGYDRHEPVLENVSFEVAAGEHIGIVGKSGSGKTTLINLVARFYDADEGRVLIDGVDVREVPGKELRRRVGVVLQEPFLFRGTIRSNIAYGVPEPTSEQILAAAKASNSHGFIMDQPLGYDTYIGDRGAGLSGGEKQRISIARALLYDPEILILDEATSSVDTESEQLIQRALEQVTAGRTTIAIAHRLSTLKDADRILVVDDGTIAEEGSHEELMAANGLYARLVKIQTELSREPTVDTLAHSS